MALKKSAHQLFTDRDEPRKAYWDALRKLEENPGQSYAITYYGEGGIGKSWLLSELRRNTERMYSGSGPVFEDGFTFRGEYIPVLYNLETSTDTVEILCQLRYALYQQKEDLVFPLFDCAVRRYMELSGKKLAQPDGTGSSVLEKYGKFLDTASMFIPGLGTLNSVYSYVKKGGSILNSALQKIEDKRIRELYKEYFEAISYSETADDIADNIVEFFRTDLNSSERDWSIVFMIDTFEVLTFSTGLNNQRWLTHDLAKHTENTLWVFAGRNRIYPQEEGNEHLLGDLSKEDTLYYLREKAGIMDEDINERIYEISHGTPIFLDICVQNYRNEGNPSIEDYRNLDKELLVKRYIKYLSDSDRLVIRLMASMSHWTDEDYRQVFNDVHNGSFSQYSEAYNRVVRSTMIEKDNEDRWFLHRAVRAGIYEDPEYPKDVKSASQTSILRLYRSRAMEKRSPFYYFERISEMIRSLASYGTGLSDEETLMLRDAVYHLLPQLYAGGTASIKELNALFDEYRTYLCHSELSKAHILAVKWTMLNYLGKYADPDYTGNYAFQVYEKVYGRTHEDTLSCLRGRVVSLSMNGHYMEALACAEDVYERTREVYGDEDDNVLHAMSVLADSCEKCEDYSRALELYRQIYDISVKKNNGKEDRRAVSILQEIAKVHKDLGNYKEALEEGRHVCEYYLKEVGENDPATINSMNSLAVTYAFLGDYTTALRMYQDAYDRASRLLGKDHPGVLVHLTNVASAYKKTGDYGKAMEGFREVYEILEATLGKEDPRTIDALVSIGSVYELQGDYSKAMELYEEAYRRSLNRYGEAHLETVSCLVSIALLEKAREHFDQAASLYERILSLRTELLGQDHPDTVTAEMNLADLYRLSRDYQRALELYQEIYEKRKRILGEDSATTINTRASIAICMSRMGDSEGALSINRETYRMMAEKEGRNSEQALTALFNVGKELEATGKAEEALETMEEVYAGHTAASGGKSVNALNTLREIGRLQKILGRTEEALQTIEKTYTLACETMGDSSIRANMYLSELGFIHYEMKNYPAALSVFEKLYSKLCIIYGKDNSHTMDALRWKGQCLYFTGQKEESLQALETVLPEYISRYGEDSTNVKNLRGWITGIRKELGHD